MHSRRLPQICTTTAQTLQHAGNPLDGIVRRSGAYRSGAYRSGALLSPTTSLAASCFPAIILGVRWGPLHHRNLLVHQVTT
jgi:hypothetical protein